MLSGVRSPGTKMGTDGKPDPKLSEMFANEAQYFTEFRLLQVNYSFLVKILKLVKTSHAFKNQFYYKLFYPLPLI